MKTLNLFVPLAAQTALMPALGGIAAVLATVSWVVFLGALLGAGIMSLSERHTGSVKNAMTVAGISALSGSILTSFWLIGGMPAAPQIGNVQ
jgi:hypothetical protein